MSAVRVGSQVTRPSAFGDRRGRVVAERGPRFEGDADWLTVIWEPTVSRDWETAYEDPSTLCVDSPPRVGRAQ